MSVDHSLLTITDATLAALLNEPALTPLFIGESYGRVVRLDSDAIAISALTAEDREDPLALFHPKSDFGAGRIGAEGDSAADVGYGRAEHYDARFVARLAERLTLWTVETFAGLCDVEWLEQHDIYPGQWLDPWRKPMLIEIFSRYRECVIAAAAAGLNLLVWCH